MGTARIKLKKFHRGLYEEAKSEALTYPGFKSKSIEKYSLEYQASLPKTFKRSCLGSIIDDIKRSGMFIYGDFHTLKQSQKGFVRLLNSLTIHSKGQDLVIALEMFKAVDQPILDAYMNSEIDEATLLDRCNYYEDWSFPWDHYKCILEFAKSQRFRVVGVNTNHAGRDPLIKRDRFAANILWKLREENPNSVVACLIGEFHLGDHSLLYELSKKNGKDGEKTPVRIFTNVDQYYFKRQDPINNGTEYLALKPKSYCLLNAPPWIKWQSYCLWEEMRNLPYQELEVDDDFFFTEEQFDIEFHIHQTLNHLAEFLQLEIDPRELTRFQVETSPDQDIFNLLKSRHRLKKPAMNLAVSQLSSRGFYFETNTNTILLADISLNNLAKVSGQFIHNIQRQYSLVPLEETDQFIYRCFNSAAGEIAAKILNPKIRSRDFQFFKDFVENHRGKRMHGSAKQKRETFREFLKFHKNCSHNSGLARLAYYCKKDRELDYRLSRCVGEFMGHSIYSSVMNHALPTSTFRRLFTMGSGKRGTLGSFIDLFQDMVNL